MHLSTNTDKIILLIIGLYFCNVSAFQKCAVLQQFTHSSSTSNDYVIPDLFKIPDFVQEYFPDGNLVSFVNNNYNLKINSECSLSLCKEKYFGGSCVSFTQHAQNVNNFGNISSGICECKKENCDCSIIPVRKESCAYAFITPCNSCNPEYVEIKEGSSPVFQEAFNSNVRTISVRGGCVLNTFDEEDFEGVEATLDNESGGDPRTWNNSAKIGSAECKCNWSSQSTFDTNVKNNISIIQLPNTVQDIISLGESERNHPGISAALSSIRKRRSPTTAYILFLGSSGSGKSTLINLMFGNPTLSPVGGSSSTTSDIREFRVSIPLPELGLNNTEIHLIDTPGLGDTRGLENDGKFLATLSDFLSNHDDLQYYIPNVIIICHKFTDNRFSGVGSSFVRMLRALNFVSDKITDDTYSNVIFTFTHFLSEVSMKKNPDPRLAEFSRVISEYTLFPKPIVVTVAENMAAEHGLTMTHYNYLLPNGELFPKNIYDKIFRICHNSNDSIGLAVFESALHQGMLKYPELYLGSKLNSLLPRNDSKTVHYTSKLTAALLDIQDSEISQRLAQTFANMSSEYKTGSGNTLPLLQKGLNIRNLRNLRDLPKTNVDKAELFSSLRLNKAGLILMEKALQLQPPPFPTTNSHSLLVGNSMNVARGNFEPLYSRVVQIQPADNNKELIVASELGYTFPSHIKYSYNSVPQIVQTFTTFANIQDYFEKRGATLGIKENLSTVKSTVVPQGINLISESRINYNYTFTAYQGIRTFKLELNHQKLIFAPSFVKDVNNLTKFNEHSYRGMEKWKDFFNKYGTHLVDSVHGGGLITLEFKKDINNPNIPSVESVFKLLDSEHGTNNSSLTATAALNKGYHGQQIIDLNRISFQEKQQILNLWKKSLHSKPTILPQSVQIISLGEIVGAKVDRSIGDEINSATKRLISGTLIYKPSPREQQNLQICQNNLVAARNSSAISNLEAEIASVKNKMELYVQKLHNDGKQHLARIIPVVAEKYGGLYTLNLLTEKVKERNKCQQRFKV